MKPFYIFYTQFNKTLQVSFSVFHNQSLSISSSSCTHCLSILLLSASSKESKHISLIGCFFFFFFLTSVSTGQRQELGQECMCVYLHRCPILSVFISFCFAFAPHPEKRHNYNKSVKQSCLSYNSPFLVK